LSAKRFRKNIKVGKKKKKKKGRGSAYVEALRTVAALHPNHEFIHAFGSFFFANAKQIVSTLK
jgi:hypothetical protein